MHAGYRADLARRLRWDGANPGNRAIREELARAVLALSVAERSDRGRFLDVGCGTGWWLARLRAEGVEDQRLTGVELLGERVLAAAERVPGARVLHADARHLPLPDGAADVITLFSVLSLMRGPESRSAALAEVRRVAAPGALIVVWEPRWPTPNRHTDLVGLRELRSGLGGELTSRTMTLAPPLARRVGPLYGLLVCVPPLRSHRLVVARLTPKPA